MGKWGVMDEAMGPAALGPWLDYCPPGQSEGRSPLTAWPASCPGSTLVTGFSPSFSEIICKWTYLQHLLLRLLTSNDENVSSFSLTIQMSREKYTHVSN